jgi:hypothetical protein
MSTTGLNADHFDAVAQRVGVVCKEVFANSVKCISSLHRHVAI